MVFSVIGAILAIIQLLSIVLACCYANQIAKQEEDDRERWEYEHNFIPDRPRPGTPQSSLRSHNHETTF
jgi:hypothetical protein